MKRLVKKILIERCDQCDQRVWKLGDNYCNMTGSKLPEEEDEHLGIPIPEDCPLEDA